MTTEPEKRLAPEVKPPTLRGLLARAVRALEGIALQLADIKLHLSDLVDLQGRGGLLVTNAQPPATCEALYVSKDTRRPFHPLETDVATGGSAMVGEIHCERAIDDAGKHLPVPGLDDDVHTHSTPNGTMCWQDDEAAS
jgi:hypothetical protein